MKSVLILSTLTLVALVSCESEPELVCPKSDQVICDISQCRSDDQCDGGKRCCTNDCGSRICLKPVICEYCPQAEIKNCTYGQSEKIVNECRVCKCAENPCKNMKCESNECIVVFEREYNHERVARGRCVPKDLPKECYREDFPITSNVELPYYHYDIVDEGCVKHTSRSYINLKRFKSFEECTTTCKINCAIPKCRPCRHGYKRLSDGCPSCDCKSRTKICQELLCPQDCIAGFKMDRYGCPTCECKPVEAVKGCYEPKVVGPCSPRSLRYYYDASINKCKPFLFGCGGNRNNFLKYDECIQKCANPGCPAVMCASSCDHGFNYNSEGCQTCTCAHRHICKGIVCAENYSCVGMTDCSGGHCKETFQCLPEDTVPRTTSCYGSKIHFKYIIIGVVLIVVLAIAAIVLFIKMKGMQIIKSKIKPQSKKNSEKPPIDTSQVVSVETITYPEEKKVPLA